MNTQRLIEACRIDRPNTFRLKDHVPEATGPFESKEQVPPLLEKDLKRMAELHEMMYAQGQWSLLLIFQAMDAAGKDSTIKHVMSGVNPQGCQVHSFKAPSAEELAHDFLWRTTCRLPERGRIGIFNRSYYEETLVVRVHPELLARQNIPPRLVTKTIWKDRFEDIVGFERHLARNGVVIRKFFLHVSKKEQRQRFQSRLEEPAKNWKFTDADIEERRYWDDYMDAYEDMIRHTSTPAAPWYVIPADHKWFTRLVVAAVIVEALREMDPAFPVPDEKRRRELARLRAAFSRNPRA